MTLATFAVVAVVVWMTVPEGSEGPGFGNLLCALSLFAGMAALFAYREQSPARQAWELHVGFGVLVAANLASLVSGSTVHLHATIDALAELVGVWVLCVACTVIGRSWPHARRLIAVILAVCALQATYGVLMVLTGVEYGAFGPKVLYRGSAIGTFVNRNHFAAFLALGAVLGVGWLVGHMRRGSRSWREFGRGFLDALLGEKGRVRLVLVVLVIGIVMSRSRMGNAAFVLALSVASFAWLLARRFAVSRTFVVLLASFVLIDGLLIGGYFGLDQVAERLEQTSFAAEERDEVVRDSFELIEQRPIAGWGAGTFEFVYPSARGADVAGSYSAAHNDYVQALVEIGAIGMLGYAWLAGALAWSGWRAMGAADHGARSIGFAGVMAVVYFLLHAAVEFNGQVPAITHLLAIVLGLTWAAGASRSRAAISSRAVIAE